ncbi:MAG: class I SAM-dependent methyltransferase [Thermodesulfobacteriota bacterium]
MSRDNRFEDFFADDAYVSLKNHLYNYLLRKRAIRKCIQFQKRDLILEVGSGLSPMVDDSEQIVYSELSFAALRTLKSRQGRGFFVVADATHLPFKTGSFSQVICSEVLEHLPEDRLALREMASVMSPRGCLVLTFPHRRGYFAGDDRFVNHFRRYELDEMEAILKEAGLKTVEIQKVLGPLEKMTMLSVISLISVFGRFWKGKRDCRQGTPLSGFIVYVFRWLNRFYCAPIWLDARLAPRCLSSVLLVRAVRRS